MKARIKKELKREKAREKPNAHYIGLLETLLKKDPITMKDWVDSGRFIQKGDYLSREPEAKLHKDCSDVVKYAGCFIIQALKTGGYLVALEGAETEENFDTLDEAESFLWENQVKNY